MGAGGLTALAALMAYGGACCGRDDTVPAAAMAACTMPMGVKTDSAARTAVVNIQAAEMVEVCGAPMWRLCEHQRASIQSRARAG